MKIVISLVISLIVSGIIILVGMDYFDYGDTSKSGISKTVDISILKNNSNTGEVSTPIVDTVKYEGEKNNLIKNIVTITSTPIDTTNLDEKYQAMRELKNILYDTKVYPVIRSTAGETIVNTFFNVGMQLGGAVFDNSKYTERDIYDMAKYSHNIYPTERLSLLIPYIGLRFYPTEMSQEIVLGYIKLYESLSRDKKTPQCGNINKIGSLVYLAKKNNIDLGSKYRDYNIFFEKSMNMCSDGRKSTIALMWLGALTDEPSETINISKIDDLVDLIITKKSPTDDLVRNLRQAYFSKNREPDTESIVLRTMQVSPKFKSYIETF